MAYLIEKDQAFLREVLFEALPDIFHSEEIRTRALAHPKVYNIPYLVEIAMEKYGHYNYVDEAGYDFDDYSDCRTMSIKCVDDRGRDRYSTSSDVTNKIGALRICLFNPYKPIGEQISFFFIPKSGYNYSLSFCWNESKVEEYGKKCHNQVESFEILAKSVA
mgnify:CR=1 FL=1